MEERNRNQSRESLESPTISVLRLVAGGCQLLIFRVSNPRISSLYLPTLSPRSLRLKIGTHSKTLMTTHAQKLRNLLTLLLASELGEYQYIASGGGVAGNSRSIRIVPPQVPSNIKMQVAGGRGIECLIYQDPRIEPNSMQADFEFYEVVLRQHNLDQPTSKAQQLMLKMFSGIRPMRQQQAQIKGETRLEQVYFEIPRFYNFDGEHLRSKLTKILP